jgi:DNA-binding SARP family transcriptional activator
MQVHLAVTPHLLFDDGTAKPLASKDAALLAWLAIEGPTLRARLAELLWPDSEPKGARNVMRQRLFKLRKQADQDLVSGINTVSLAADVAHDLMDSDSLLGAMDLKISPEFDAWVQAQRALRRERRRYALVQMSTQAERENDYGTALGHAHAAVALEPLSEESHRRVMRLHYLAGDRAAALLAFDA